jgi:Condensation domain
MPASGRRATQAYRPTSRADVLTCAASYAQESFLTSAGASAINVPAVARLGDDVGPAQVRRILAVLVARHGALRTVLTRAPNGPALQHVRPTGTVPLVVSEHWGTPRSLLAELLLAGSEQPFLVHGGALCRAELHRFGTGGQVLMVWLHHAVSDLVSSHVLAEEVRELSRGGALPARGFQLADFAVQERAVRATAPQWLYWTETLRSVDDRLGVPYPAGTAHQAIRPALPRLPTAVVEALGRLAAAHRTTLTAVLAAAVVAAHAGEATSSRCVIGLTISNRHHPRLRSTVGCLADQLPLVVDIGGRPTFRELLGRVREALLDAYDARLPLGLLLPLLGRPAPPVLAVNLNFVPPPPGPVRGAQPGGAMELPYGITKRRAEPWWLGDAALAYRPRIDAAGLAGEIEGDAYLQDAEEIQRRGERFCAVLAAAAGHPDRELT